MKKTFLILLAVSLSSVSSYAANSVTKKANEVKDEAGAKAATMSQEHSAHKNTADSQMKGSDADVAVTRKIRDQLTDMDGLSTRAQNITIVTKGNNVTLKGEVDKQEEIQKVMDVAQGAASGKKIDNQLTIHK